MALAPRTNSWKFLASFEGSVHLTCKNIAWYPPDYPHERGFFEMQTHEGVTILAGHQDGKPSVAFRDTSKEHRFLESRGEFQGNEASRVHGIVSRYFEWLMDDDLKYASTFMAL